MDLFIPRNTKVVSFNALGNTTAPTLKNRCAESIRLRFLDAFTGQQAALANGSTIVVRVKTAKDSTELIASASSFTATGTAYVGWLDLDNDAANALTDGAEVFLEIEWTENDHTERTDDAKLIIATALSDGSEDVPTDGSAASIAAWLNAHILAGTGLTVTPDEDAGTITIDGSQLQNAITNEALQRATADSQLNSDLTSLSETVDAHSITLGAVELIELTTNGNLKLTINGQTYYALLSNTEP